MVADQRLFEKIARAGNRPLLGRPVQAAPLVSEVPSRYLRASA